MKKMKSLLLVLFMGFIFALPSASAESLISGINIEGIGDMKSIHSTYNLELETSFDYTNITVTAKDPATKIEGAGKVSIKEGANPIVITATNGTQKETITINLKVKKISGKAANYEKGATTNPETGAFMNYSLIALAVGSSLVIINKNKKKTKFFRI